MKPIRGRYLRFTAGLLGVLLPIVFGNLSGAAGRSVKSDAVPCRIQHVLAPVESEIPGKRVFPLRGQGEREAVRGPEESLLLGTMGAGLKQGNTFDVDMSWSNPTAKEWPLPFDGLSVIPDASERSVENCPARVLAVGLWSMGVMRKVQCVSPFDETIPSPHGPDENGLRRVCRSEWPRDLVYLARGCTEVRSASSPPLAIPARSKGWLTLIFSVGSFRKGSIRIEIKDEPGLLVWEFPFELE